MRACCSYAVSVDLRTLLTVFIHMADHEPFKDRYVQFDKSPYLVFFSTQIVHPHLSITLDCHQPKSQASHKILTTLPFSLYCGVAVAKQMLSSTYPLLLFPDVDQALVVTNYSVKHRKYFVKSQGRKNENSASKKV